MTWDTCTSSQFCQSYKFRLWYENKTKLFTYKINQSSYQFHWFRKRRKLKERENEIIMERPLTGPDLRLPVLAFPAPGLFTALPWAAAFGLRFICFTRASKWTNNTHRNHAFSLLNSPNSSLTKVATDLSFGWDPLLTSSTWGQYWYEQILTQRWITTLVLFSRLKHGYSGSSRILQRLNFPWKRGRKWLQRNKKGSSRILQYERSTVQTTVFTLHCRPRSTS